LNDGGSLQIATSFISDLATNHVYKCSRIHLCISNALHENLMSLNIDLSHFASILKLDFNLKNSLIIRKYLNQFEVIFTIMGPAYLFFLGNSKHICGFAQPWICYRQFSMDVKISYFKRRALYVKFFIQKWFFEKADLLVVESSAVRTSLLDNCGFKSEVSIVSNCVAETFRQNNTLLAKKKYLNGNAETINFGFIGKAYKHKNIDVLKPVFDILIDKYELNLHLFVTFSDEELRLAGLQDCSWVTNLGTIRSDDLVDFYSKIDFLIFPTLLECFSVSPLEAMSQFVVVFASDRPFIRDSCLDHAIYIDPLNVEKMALKIFENIKNKELLRNRAKAAHNYSLERGGNDRTKAYLNLLESGWCSND
jgi:glycosyltransferase involved in cell wall biosynthesis